MEFRWAALISLWTMLAGPALKTPRAPTRPDQSGPAVKPAAGQPENQQTDVSPPSHHHQGRP
jgi:hypothetical protein